MPHVRFLRLAMMMLMMGVVAVTIRRAHALRRATEDLVAPADARADLVVLRLRVARCVEVGLRIRIW